MVSITEAELPANLLEWLYNINRIHNFQPMSARIYAMNFLDFKGSLSLDT